MSKFLTLKSILDLRPIKTPLSFGLNDNVRLTAISNETRDREGEILLRNTYLTFTQFDKENKQLAQTEFSFYNLDPTKETLITDLATQINQLTNIAQIFDEDAILDPTAAYEDLEDLQKALKDDKGCKKIINELYNQFEKVVSKKVGNEGPLMRLKVVVNKNNYPQLSNKDSKIVESMSINAENTGLTMSYYDKNVRAKALEEAVKPKEADNSGAPAPAINLLNGI